MLTTLTDEKLVFVEENLGVLPAEFRIKLEWPLKDPFAPYGQLKVELAYAYIQEILARQRLERLLLAIIDETEPVKIIDAILKARKEMADADG